MKNRWRVLVLFLVLLPGCQKFSWREFTSAEGGFSVLMPGEAQAKTRTADTQAGPITTHLFLYAGDQAAYMVGYTDYPEAVKQKLEIQKAYDDARDADLASSGSTLISETPIMLMNTYPGREEQTLLKQGDGKHAIRSRMFLVNGRLYQTLVVAPRDELFSPDAVKFMDSFKLK